MATISAMTSEVKKKEDLGREFPLFPHSGSKFFKTVLMKTSAISLCVGKSPCLIFTTLAGTVSFPNSLKDFLGDMGVIFMGVGMNYVAEQLMKNHQVTISNPVELGEVVKKAFGNRVLSAGPKRRVKVGLQEMSLYEMAQVIVFGGVEVKERPFHLQNDGWSAGELKKEEVTTATVDAFLICAIEARSRGKVLWQ